MIHIEGLHFQYREGDFHLRIPELSVEPGTTTAFIGPSGSGKTLLLRTIADLDPADRGEVLLQGRHRASFSPAAWRGGRVAFVGVKHHPGIVDIIAQAVLDIA